MRGFSVGFSVITAASCTGSRLLSICSIRTHVDVMVKSCVWMFVSTSCRVSIVVHQLCDDALRRCNKCDLARFITGLLFTVQSLFVICWACAETKLLLSTCLLQTVVVVYTSQHWPTTSSYLAICWTWTPSATSQCASRFTHQLLHYIHALATHLSCFIQSSYLSTFCSCQLAAVWLRYNTTIATFHLGLVTCF